jgi:hypothetical protein
MTEAQLCDVLRDWAEGLGFAVYPEVRGWDLVLVAPEDRAIGRLDVAPGEQVGIHAKLRANCDVLAQALPPTTGGPYPQHPFVAAPIAGQGFRAIASRLGIGVIATAQRPRRRRWGQPEAGGPVVLERPSVQRGAPHPPLPLPPVASRAIVAGAPSPRVLSEWRVKALRFLACARGRATFTVATLEAFGLGRSWVDRWGVPVDWELQRRGNRAVRVRTYRLTSKEEHLPDWGYRDVAAELALVEAGAVLPSGT